jgi:hypothetical protein
MNKKFSHVVLEDGKPICIGESLKYVREYLDDYCGVERLRGEFVDFVPDNSKYPDDYQGKFVYKEFWDTKDGILQEETLHFKVYLVDVALPTIEQKREDNIDELLN